MSAQVRSLTITPTQLDLMTVPVVIDGQVRSVSFAAKHIRLLVPDALRRKVGQKIGWLVTISMDVVGLQELSCPLELPQPVTSASFGSSGVSYVQTFNVYTCIGEHHKRPLFPNQACLWGSYFL